MSVWLNKGLSSLFACKKGADPCIRKLLQRFPRFSYGHRRLAEMALAHDDVATAYASAHALVALSGESAISHYLFGRCFIKRASYDKAAWHLEAADKIRPNNAEILEELAAAYVFQKRFEEAERLIEKIDSKKLSQHGLQLKEYLRKREDEKHGSEKFN